MSDWYILDGNNTPKAVPLLEGAAWISRNLDRKIVGKDHVDESEVSTVFLGLNHAHLGGPPVLFETMIFGGPYDQHQERYCTWSEAKAGHDRVLKNLRAGLQPDA